MPKGFLPLAVDLPTILLSSSTAILLLIALRGALSLKFPGRNGFIAMQLSAAWWAGAATLEIAATSPVTKVFWAEMAWLGIVLTPTYWALFTWTYVQGDYRPLSKGKRWALLVVPVLTWVVALTNDAHHLMYSQTLPMSDAPGAAILYVHGLWFYGAIIYLYAFMLLSMVLVVNALQRAPSLYRRHFLCLAAAMLLPWLANIGYVTGTFLLFDFDPTPFSFLVMGAIFYWQLSRRQLVDVVPIARNMLVDAMPDPVVVLNGDGIIVEANIAALGIAAISGKLTGKPLAAVPILHQALTPLLADSGPLRQDIEIGDGPHHFDIRRVPLTYKNRAVGELFLFRDITHRKLAELRLSEAKSALEAQLETNMLLQRQLREQATRDVLTGLLNRRFFEEIRSKLLAEAQETGLPLAVIMIDLDHFKKLNDSRGHQAGDEVLRAIGTFLLHSVRQSDYVFRMGGEELLLLLPGLNDLQAQARIEAWRQSFTGMAIPMEGGCLSATFSAGVAAFPQDAADLDELLHRADMALYRAKAEGRNRVCRWQEAMTLQD